jgi:hypothetical protein
MIAIMELSLEIQRFNESGRNAILPDNAGYGNEFYIQAFCRTLPDCQVETDKAAYLRGINTI